MTATEQQLQDAPARTAPQIAREAGVNPLDYLIERFPFRRVSVSFVPGRRIGRQAYLKVDGSENNLRLPELPERARILVRHTRRVWIAGPDERGRLVAMTRGLAFLVRGRVVER